MLARMRGQTMLPRAFTVALVLGFVCVWDSSVCVFRIGGPLGGSTSAGLSPCRSELPVVSGVSVAGLGPHHPGTTYDFVNGLNLTCGIAADQSVCRLPLVGGSTSAGRSPCRSELPHLSVVSVWRGWVPTILASRMTS